MRNNKLIKKILVISIIFIMMIVFNDIEIFARSESSDNKKMSEYVMEEIWVADEEEDSDEEDSGFVDPTENPGYWKPETKDEPELRKKAGVLLGVINVLGVVSSVIALTLLGMKYFLGSVEEKADFKKSLWIYILGIVLLVLCSTLPNIIFNISQGVFK